MRRTPSLLAAGTAVALGLVILPIAPPASAAADVVVLTTLSNRADIVSDGNALVQVDLPSGATIRGMRVDVDGRNVTSQFAVRPNGEIQGVLTGLKLGKNVLKAELPDGRGARLTITNYPIGGPVFSGPQIQPWTCTGESLDKQCNRAPAYRYYYKSTSGGALKEFSPDSPPSDIATTTTDTGETVPFVVRQETGVLARDEYRIAAIYDLKAPQSAPWAPPKGYASKLVITHGASCDTSYAMGAAPAVLNEVSLGKGMAVMSHALDNAGHNCNIVTQAESLVMTKEKVIEQFGPIRYTIGTGCSGGSLVQQQIANAYPGLYQGISPACSFTDAWSSAQQYVDYAMLRAYFEDPTKWAPGVVWTPIQLEAAYGHPNPANPISFTEVIPNGGDPSRSCPGVPAADVYSETNKDGVRCSFQDYMVNVFGETADGRARSPFDNTGIMYGLSGLADGTMLPAQFVDLNVKIGSFDLDYEPQAKRAVADPLALQRVFRSGAVNTGNALDQVAIIDLRGPDPGAFHDVYRTYSMRERLIREHGTADNQVLWRGQVVLFGDTNFVDEAIVALDKWLAEVEKDTRAVPLAQKVLAARTAAGITERCTNGAGVALPAAVCDTTVTAYASPRIEAGAPVADDVMKCQLKPLERTSFGVAFADAQWAALQQAFPTGVCDYSKPSVSKQAAVQWMTYAPQVGGTPLGVAPVSVPFGPQSAPTVTRPGTTLPTTGGSVALAVLGLVLVGAAVQLRRRHT